jgi:hypothetical protein
MAYAKYEQFILEIVEGLTEQRIGNFDREQNTDDAYTFEEFEEEYKEFMNDNFGDVSVGDRDYAYLTKLREDPYGPQDIWSGVCEDLENHYKEQDKRECQWGGCDDEAVCCKTYGLEYCAEHICESQGGDWCDDETCEACNEARRLLRIMLEEDEKNNGVHGWAVAT